MDMTAEQRDIILQLLHKHLPHTTVWAYGSRARGTSRPQSDLDMVVFTDRQYDLNVSNLKEDFDESNLPFRVDLFVWNDIPEEFQRNILNEHVVLQEK